MLVFMVVYLVGSILAGDFYKVPLTVAFLVASAYAVCITPNLKLKKRINIFSRGAGDENLMLMVWIFVLAGAFAKTAGAMGAIDATVDLTLRMLPDSMLLPGLFLAACFISLSIGTSVGTVVALTPVAVGIAEQTGSTLPLIVAIVVGGSFFGDNLSFISDTTIAATRSQGAEMRDKFRENAWIAAPAALATLALLALLGDSAPVPAAGDAPPWLALPYVLVLVLAVAGLDVVLVLGIGLVVAGLAGLAMAPEYGPVDFVGDIYAGFESMVEITLLSILIGGLAALIRACGGLDWLARVISKFARGHTGRRSGEFSIAALAAGTDALTANNTVAILVSGDVARDIAQRHGVSPRRAASVLDIFACVVQGVLPYGAQILLAASLAAVSPLALAGSVHYCWLLALSAVAFMLWPARHAAPAATPAD